MIVLNDFRHDARVHKEAKTLAAEGHEVLILALESAELPNHEVVDGFTVERAKIVTRVLPNCVISRIVRYLEYSARNLSTALTWKADVYHAHDANTLPVARLASWLQGAKLIYDAHELETGRNWGNSNLSHLVRRLWPVPEKLLIGGASAVITVCDSIASELERLYDIESPWVVRNVPERRPVRERVDLREMLGIDNHTPLILYQGGVKANRGIEQMLEAISLLDRGALVLLGDGPSLPSLQTKVREGGLASRVFFLGHIPLAELPRYTACADIGLALIQNACLSYYYSLPNKLFEYIQAGLPVIVSDFPEMARIVREYDLGELVDPSKPAEIATGIQRILSDPQYYRRLKENALKAADELNWDRERMRLLALYENLRGNATG